LPGLEGVHAVANDSLVLARWVRHKAPKDENIIFWLSGIPSKTEWGDALSPSVAWIRKRADAQYFRAS
jgi:hypothetical protein